jgi:glycerol-3-phosphate cytidylyltransferase
VSAIRYVDCVIQEVCWSQKQDDVRNRNIDVFVIGDDWRDKFDDLLAGLCEIVYLPRTPDISTSGIKHALSGAAEVQPLKAPQGSARERHDEH